MREDDKPTPSDYLTPPPTPIPTPNKLKAHTVAELHKSMNSLLEFLSFTVETDLDYETGYIPTLDLELKMLESGVLTYRFCEKSMASKFCGMSRVAMGREVQSSVLTQEVYRRMSNTREGSESQLTRNLILEEFTSKGEFTNDVNHFLAFLGPLPPLWTKKAIQAAKTLK